MFKLVRTKVLWKKSLLNYTSQYFDDACIQMMIGSETSLVSNQHRGLSTFKQIWENPKTFNSYEFTHTLAHTMNTNGLGAMAKGNILQY